MITSFSDRSFLSLAKNIFNNFQQSTFPSLFCSNDTIAISLANKATLFGSLFLLFHFGLQHSFTSYKSYAPSFNFFMHSKKQSSSWTQARYMDQTASLLVLKGCASELKPVLAHLSTFA